MPDLDKAVEQAKAVKEKYEAELMRKKHVVGVGVGFKREDGEVTNQVAIIVNVEKKVPPDQLDGADTLPDELEGIPVDVVETGLIEVQQAQKRRWFRWPWMRIKD